MNVPVKVHLRLAGKVVTVMSDELHALLHDGQLTYADAMAALRETGVKLEHLHYPWLKNVPKDSNEEPEPQPEPIVNEQPDEDVPSEAADNSEGA